MTSTELRNLAVLTITSPAEAARQVLANCPPRDVLWLAFALAVVLNTLVQAASALLFPVVDPELQVLYDPVWQVLFTTAGALLLSIGAFFLIGRLFGGEGSFDGIMALLIWLQYLQVAAQALIFFIVMILPGLFRPLILAMSLFSLYITLHFLNQAHRFGSLGKSFLVILISGVAAIPFVLLLTPGGPE
ncbi:Yip1 family protein [Ruegeria sp.]|uniref:Yip1 family protein n=1 Tax=Ruegeria sp. TaxID=1879320 RepID=UPI003C7CE1ED